ncbi:uncharacterized protein TNCV_42421 [Trichonephila clavipes]|nr:uncharacterized protein TNCV_42421 [Trichonephila clavipes]
MSSSLVPLKTCRETGADARSICRGSNVFPLPSSRKYCREVGGREEKWEAPVHVQGVLPQNLNGTEPNSSVTSMVLKGVAVAEWYRYRTVACFVTGSSPVPLKTRRVGQRCTLNLSRAETSSRWCGVVVRRGGTSSDVVHVT